MHKWMVDCYGDNGEASLDSMYAAMESLDFATLVERQGSLAASVQRAIVDMGLHITDRGGGVSGWHVGVPFDGLREAVDYLQRMTVRFARAIGSGMLRFTLKTWSAEAWKPAKE